MAGINGSTVPSSPSTRPEPLEPAALVLETERFRMRPLGEEDIDLAHDIFLEEVVACTDPENHASQHVLKKSGLRDVGLRRAYGAQIPGFEVTRREWLDFAAK